MLADLDNTLVPYGVTEPPEEIVAWKQALEAQGIQLFLLSNSRRPGRPRASPSGWASPIRGTPASPGGRAISGPWSAWGAGRRETGHGGRPDLHRYPGGQQRGVVPMLVEPIRLAGNPGRYLRYAAETPSACWESGRPFL